MGATLSNASSGPCQNCTTSNWFAWKSASKEKSSSGKKPKVIIIGDKESGKRTLVKQIMLLHASLNSEEATVMHERSAWKTIITLYIFNRMRSLLREMVPDSQYESVARLTKFRANSLKDFDRKWRQVLSQDVLDVVKNPNFTVHKYANERLRYFLDNIERICDSLYQPSTQDILHCDDDSMLNTKASAPTQPSEANVFEMQHMTVQLLSSDASKKAICDALKGATHLILLSSLKNYDPLLQDQGFNSSLFASVQEFEKFKNILQIKRKRHFNNVKTFVLLSHYDQLIANLKSKSGLHTSLIERYVDYEVQEFKSTMMQTLRTTVETMAIDLLNTEVVSDWLVSNVI